MSTHRPRRRFSQRALTLGLLMVLFARLTGASNRLSFTSDEPSHIATGYAYLARGATWTVPLRGHPPLLDAWLTLPFYAGDPAIPLETLDGWEKDNTAYVKAFVPAVRDNVLRAEIATRTPAMLLTVLLAAVVSRWARDLGGAPGAALSLLVLAGDPTLLAHGMLATNDVGVTALGTLALFLTQRLLRRPSPARVAGTSLALALTMLAKGSGVIWLAAVGLMILAGILLPRTGSRRARTVIGLGIAVTVTTLLCIWAAYGFEWGALQIGTVSLPVPAPTHWRAILAQSTGAEARHTYFLGQVRKGGHWAYFPVAALVKNPVPLLMLTGWGLVASIRSHSPRRRAAPLWLFPTLYGAMAVISGVNIGYRHMLPIHPFLYLAVAAIPSTRRLVKLASAALISWLILESLIVAPHYISYASPIVGGAQQGWRYLADSNTDWGQGYKALADYQRTLGDARAIQYSGPEGYIGVSTYGAAYEALPPIPSNPDPIMLPDIRPAPGLYAISANSLSGLGCAASDNYAWFRYHEPVAVLADAIHVYDVPAESESAWIAQCTAPAPPLEDTDIQARLSLPRVRQLALDCTQSWVIPASGPGWIALHDQLMDPATQVRRRLGLVRPQPIDGFLSRRLASLSLSYRQWDYRETPAFLVYDGVDGPALPPSAPTVAPAPAGSLPGDLPATEELPVELQGPLSLIGVVAYPAEAALEIETWWQVTGAVGPEPFSAMAHLVRSDGQAIAVADGFAVPPPDLARGDVVVQRHIFPDHNITGLWFRTGLYWSETTQLWPTASCAGCDAIFVSLDQAIVR